MHTPDPANQLQHTLGELRRIAASQEQVTVTHNETFENYGTVRHTETATLTAPITHHDKESYR